MIFFAVFALLTYALAPFSNSKRLPGALRYISRRCRSSDTEIRMTANFFFSSVSKDILKTRNVHNNRIGRAFKRTVFVPFTLFFFPLRFIMIERICTRKEAKYDWISSKQSTRNNTPRLPKANKTKVTINNDTADRSCTTAACESGLKKLSLQANITSYTWRVQIIY